MCHGTTQPRAQQPAAGRAPATPAAPRAAPASKPRPKVVLKVVRADGGAETAYQMTSDSLGIGSQGPVLLPDDPFVAGAQARLFFSGGRLAIEDVGGGNGTYVRLRQAREVAPGAEFRVGRQRLLLEAILPITPAPDKTVAVGSPDPGSRLRVIQLFEGGARGGAFLLKPGENLLGREQGDLTFPGDGFVSGRHAALQVDDTRVALKDLGSSNGTFLRLGPPHFVENQDQFLIGRELVRVELSA
jgi:pSer/pThr/pTyr-binding forkhead associated (FHA) protein